MAKDKVRKHWKPTLQALSYWIGYKKQYFHGNLLPEGAIVAELTQLLSANVESGYKIECERMFKDFGCTNMGNQRMDIAIGKMLNGEKKRRGDKIIESDELYEVIEVKRYEGDRKKLFTDLEKLSKLKMLLPQVRCYLLVVGQKKLPNYFFTDKHNLKKRNIYDGSEDVKAYPRMAQKAYASRKSKYGSFSFIIEVLSN